MFVYCFSLPPIVQAVRIIRIRISVWINVLCLPILTLTNNVSHVTRFVSSMNSGSYYYIEYVDYGMDRYNVSRKVYPLAKQTNLFCIFA